jgi:rhamnosyltransferase
MEERQMSIGVVVPTLNAAVCWPEFHAGLAMQRLPIQRVLIMDSSSTDGTAELARSAGYEVVIIPRAEFNHGATRQAAADLLADVDIVVYLTQDAMLASEDSIARLLVPFRDPEVGAAYGRQLPRKGAGVLEAHARMFNYPAESAVRDLKSRETTGIKTIFASNSFAAYRATALHQAGGFPKIVHSEDTVVFARMLLGGWKTAYAADATVYHSHSYSVIELMRRYYDIGVMHATEPWLLEEFGQTRGEGARFVLSEWSAVWPRHIHLLPVSCGHTLAKFIGYQFGLQEHKLLRRKDGVAGKKRKLML